MVVASFLRLATHPVVASRFPDVDPAAWIRWAGELGIVHGADREEALARLSTALEQSRLAGIETNLDYLARVVTEPAFREGRLLQLSRRVLALGAGRDFLGLWNASYTLFGAALRDEAGERHGSALHQLTLTYSVSDNAEAVFSLVTASGRGLAADGTVRSEFGHVPNSLYVSLQLVL